MISVSDYFGPHEDSPDATAERKLNAHQLLDRVNALLEAAEAHGVGLDTNPQTRTLVSGVSYGGFRPQVCPQGAMRSAHKEAEAVDIYDPHGALDRWITDAILEKHDLYREHPADTSGWCHLSTRAPGSGRRTFHP